RWQRTKELAAGAGTGSVGARTAAPLPQRGRLATSTGAMVAGSTPSIWRSALFLYVSTMSGSSRSTQSALACSPRERSSDRIAALSMCMAIVSSPLSHGWRSARRRRGRERRPSRAGGGGSDGGAAAAEQGRELAAEVAVVVV